MPTVYRIECTKCGLGPYNCRCDLEFHYWMDPYREDSSPNTPGMLVDMDKNIMDYQHWDRYHCGFETIIHLQKWFDATLLQTLADHGFQLARYTVNKLYYSLSGKQVFFEKNTLPEYEVIL